MRGGGGGRRCHCQRHGYLILPAALRTPRGQPAPRIRVGRILRPCIPTYAQKLSISNDNFFFGTARRARRRPRTRATRHDPRVRAPDSYGGGGQSAAGNHCAVCLSDKYPPRKRLKAPQGTIVPFAKRQIPTEEAVKAPQGTIVPFAKRQIPAEEAVQSAPRDDRTVREASNTC